MQRRSYLIYLAVLFAASGLQAADWGHLKVQFVFDGTPPKAKEEKITKDTEVCAKEKIFDERIVVGKKGELANVVVFLRESKKEEGKVPVHPDYKKTEMGEVKMDNKVCRFEPRITLLRTSQTIVLSNSDEVAHNMKTDAFFYNQPINQLLTAKSSLKHQFPLNEDNPAIVSCGIHPWMKGWLLVRRNPYMAVSDKTGTLELKNIPAGTWEFKFWHEQVGNIGHSVKIKVNGKSTKWKGGRTKLKIKSGATLNLGKIAIPAKAFED